MGSRHALQITVSVADGLAVIGVQGAMRRGVATDQLLAVVETLCESGQRRVVVHAAGVSAVDIDGLVTLMDCQAALQGVGGSLLIRSPSPALRLALRRTGLDTVLEIVDAPGPDASRQSSPAPGG